MPGYDAMGVLLSVGTREAFGQREVFEVVRIRGMRGSCTRVGLKQLAGRAGPARE